ncbi:MAG TPA: helix-turn-helix transcriptional regulator [Streptosporangiaceae bacterium]|jgi:transcriptional regulator with XRE-family HTH domain|nr:helix-turn-helix transcriptional regulator [Streptosporangiaceae bacterium]
MSSNSMRDLLELRSLIESGRAQELRESAGLSATALALDMGVNPSQVLRWEQKQRFPNGANARKYAKTLRRLADWEMARKGAAS